MKQLIAFGMALVLLFAAGTPAYTQDGDTSAEIEPFVATSEIDIDPIADQQRIDIVLSHPFGVASDRPWCRSECADSEGRTKVIYRPTNNCVFWERDDIRHLRKQLPWPFCTCVYGKWNCGRPRCVLSR